VSESEPLARGAADAPAPTSFDADTAVRRVEGSGEAAVFEADMRRGWWIVRGPNGGYVAAVLLRALEEAVGDPERTPRSLGIHYTAPPAEGPVRIETRLERTGRSLSTLSARMTQDGRLLALALAAFSRARPGPELQHARPPEVPAPGRCPSLADLPGGLRLPIHRQYEYRWALGGLPRRGAAEALCGGWIRLAEPRRHDALALAAISDAFPPAMMSAIPADSPLGAMPTVDLTIHFRATLPRAEAREDAYVLAVFRTREAREGFFEEDGEIWSDDGVLLAHSRQLAVLV